MARCTLTIEKGAEVHEPMQSLTLALRSARSAHSAWGSEAQGGSPPSHGLSMGRWRPAHVMKQTERMWATMRLRACVCACFAVPMRNEGTIQRGDMTLFVPQAPERQAFESQKGVACSGVHQDWGRLEGAHGPAHGCNSAHRPHNHHRVKQTLHPLHKGPLHPMNMLSDSRLVLAAVKHRPSSVSRRRHAGWMQVQVAVAALT
jgi:hypothetical protein